MTRHNAELISALDALLRYRGKTVVVKYGGNAMIDDDLQNAFAHDVALLHRLGIRPVVVHGGGPHVDAALALMNKTSDRVDGMRVTDAQTIQIAEMVLSGSVGKDIAWRIGARGAKAIGLSGKDGGLIRARKLLLQKTDEQGKTRSVDLGFVGEVSWVDCAALKALLDANFVPVIAPLGVGDDGHTYNINADLVACAVACALKAERLLLLTNIKGVLDKNGDLIDKITPKKADALIKDGVILGGMIPKIQSAVASLSAGLKNTTILDGRLAHACLLELGSLEGLGTQIVDDDPNA